ncbi:MAG TPA: phosphoribosylformylglycinamidine cyclo-ligase [Terriglobales bacterium]|nr:phosphoribosylformylglycinamidine cyclo-ligase [Terriglobales bacterium]
MARLTYAKAGVKIDAADRFIRMIKPLVRSTERPEVLGTIGGFSGLFRPRTAGMRAPVLVSSTDGVGTKLLVAEALGKYDTVGIDLVAMCVDDVVVLGAEPLFFLDYIAVGDVRPRMLVEIVKGIVRGCRQACCTLIGGETAELPGLYAPGKWDLAGFCVGLVDRPKIIDGRSVRPGDAVIGLASSGLHSNGYSLARAAFTEKELRGDIGRELLRPTRIYCSTILAVLKDIPVKSMAHITGGGFYDNIPRVIPEGSAVRVEKGAWPVPAIFRKIQARGRVAEREMFRTLNMGIGMVLVVAPDQAERAVSLFARLGQKAWVIGEVVKGKRGVTIA